MYIKKLNKQEKNYIVNGWNACIFFQKKSYIYNDKNTKTL